MLYTCENCRFLFESDHDVDQCPDCGKFAVRLAIQDEIEEYEKRCAEEDDWYIEADGEF